MDIAQRHKLVTSLFLQARELPQPEQEPWLRNQAAGDRDVQQEVLAMLSAERDDPGFLESASETRPHGSTRSSDKAERPRPSTPDSEDLAPAELPSRIASYTILRRLGEGGAAYVYLAQQESPRREVALKVVKPGVSAKSSFRRLEFEASVLGRMQHPGIAQIFESGLADVGVGPQPYFAMEFVVGEQLTDYARSRDLGTRDRLRLIAKIADAVEHAHQKGIIHRDLKPSNILVNSEGDPKVLDFGIARATDADLYATTLRTDIGQLLGTVPYMSPEQTLGDPDQIDTRSDVYALGVVAYELLTGRLPYDLSRKGIPEAVRIIRDEDPQHPSTASASLRGDIETILLKALHKDPDQRYQSVAELATDIRRYLDDEPILARPASATYQLRKFARRHRPLVGACLVGVLALSAATVIAMVQAHTARQAERMAAAQSKFLSDVLTQASPETQVNHDIRLVDVLQQASKALDGEFQDQPLAKASLHGTLGYTYLTLRDFPAAEKHLQAQRKILTTIAGPDDPRLLENAHYLARALIEQGRPNEAAPFLDDSIAYLRASEGADSMNTLGMMLTKARYYMRMNDTEHAKELLHQILSTVRRIRSDEHPLALICKSELADLHAKNGELAEAAQYLAEVLAVRRRVLGPAQKDTLTSMNNLAKIYTDLKRYDDAKPLLVEALPGLRRIWGPNHEEALNCQMNLVKTYVALHEYDEAEPLCRDALSKATASLGPDHILAQHAKIILTQLEQRHKN